VGVLPELLFPTCGEAKEEVAPVTPVGSGRHWDSLMRLDDAIMGALHGVFVSTYELKSALLASELVPSARARFPDLAASTTYDAAVARGFQPLGLAPANNRRGKFIFKIDGNPVRVYGGPPKPQFQAPSVFSPP